MSDNTRDKIVAQMRPSQWKQNVSKVKRQDPDARRTLGLGMAIDTVRLAAADPRHGLGDFIDLVKNSVNATSWNIPIIEQVRWDIGPLDDTAIQASFGTEIDLFGSGKSPVGVDFVETTMAIPGEAQTPLLVTGIGFHLEPEPLCWSLNGNGWTHSIVGVAPPPSPDVFTQNDRANGAINAAVAAGTEVFLPAILDWGHWANYAAHAMVRGFDIVWAIGAHTVILKESLRHTAYMPPNGQEGSASSSQVSTSQFVRRMNDRYQQMGSALDFLRINCRRNGSYNTAGGANIGEFIPTRANDLVDATFGGMDLRSALGNNKEFRQLAVPHLIPAGIPFGLSLQMSDGLQAAIMQQYLSITQGYGGAIPPVINDGGNILPGLTATIATAMTERTLPTAAVAGIVTVAQQVDADRVLFKGGGLMITQAVKGFEVEPDWYTLLQNDSDLRQIVLSELGVVYPK